MSETDDGHWLFTCGCGNVLSVKNAGIRQTTDGCDHCHASITGEDSGFDMSDGRVAHELGWCGCGSPERVDELMVDYLASEQGGILVARDDLTLLVAYMADALGWTEHGGSVTAAWLTDDGREALANLQAVLARN